MDLRFIKRIRPLSRALFKARWVGGRCFMRAAHALCGVRPKRVFFSSFTGRGYTDSPARISEALHALRPDAELVWQLSNPKDAPDYVRVVRPRTPEALFAISTARCIVENFNRPRYMLKFPDQRYVQTWHGDRPFKKVMFDMEDGQYFPDGEQMDLAVSGSDFGARMYRTAFRYGGEIMQLGMPRNDALLSPDPKAAAEIRGALGVEEGARIMLFAPTFRNDRMGEVEPASFDIGRALDALEASTGSRWRCLTRAHIENPGIRAAEDGRIRDVTAWPETTDLLLITDLLITDYSSIASDFILLGRPVILFQPDLERYLDRDRRMYFDVRTSPYARAETEAELFALLSDVDALASRSAELCRFYGMTETGRSAGAVAKWISERLGQ